MSSHVRCTCMHLNTPKSHKITLGFSGHMENMTVRRMYIESPQGFVEVCRITALVHRSTLNCDTGLSKHFESLTYAWKCIEIGKSHKIVQQAQIHSAFYPILYYPVPFGEKQNVCKCVHICALSVFFFYKVSGVHACVVDHAPLSTQK